MRKSLLQNAYAQLLKIKNRFSGKTTCISIFTHLAETRRVLIFMPVSIEEFGVALKSLQLLREKQPDWQITVVTKVEMVNFVDDRLEVDILPYSKSDLNFVGLPKKSLKQHFEKTRYDLALDLKVHLDLLCISLFQLSLAPLKVCFYSRNKSAFYNFTIRINPDEPLVNKYETLVKYITSSADSRNPKSALENTP